MSHATHIGRHLAQLQDHYDPALLKRVLDSCGFVMNGAEVQKRDGTILGDDDCVQYIQTLDAVFGSSVSSFAKVNFILSGCTAAKSVA